MSPPAFGAFLRGRKQVSIMLPLCWKPAPQVPWVLLAASCQQQGFSRSFKLPKTSGAGPRSAGLPWALLTSEPPLEGELCPQQPRNREVGRRHAGVPPCLSFPPACQFLGHPQHGQQLVGVRGRGRHPRALLQGGLQVGADPRCDRSVMLGGRHVCGPRRRKTPVFSSPDTSTQNTHSMTEARPSVEFRCKWYSSWKSRWVLPEPPGPGV